MHKLFIIDFEDTLYLNVKKCHHSTANVGDTTQAGNCGHRVDSPSVANCIITRRLLSNF